MYEIINSKTKLNDNREVIRKLILLINKTEDEEVKAKIRWEIIFLNFKFNDGKISEQRKNLGEELILEKTDPFQQFTEATFQYLTRRSEECLNPISKLIYNLIIWNSKNKNYYNAVIAIELMLKTISEKKFKFYDKYNYTYIENFIGLSLSCKHKQEEISNICSKVLKSRSSKSPYYKYLLLEVMVKSKFFKKGDFKNAEKILTEIFDSFLLDRRIFHAESLKKLAIRISGKLNIDSNQWKIKCGKIYETHANYRIHDETPIVSFNYFTEAKKEFHNAGSAKDEKRVSIKIEKLKKGKLLSKANLNIDDNLLAKVRKYAINKAELLIKEDTNRIFDYLLRGNYLYPTRSEINKNRTINGIYSDIIYSKFIFDINKNIAKKKPTISTTDQVLSDDDFLNFKIYLNSNTYPFLTHLFQLGYVSNKINFESLIKYIIENLWYGKVITGNDMGGNKYEYSWLNLLAPSFFELFKELECGLIILDQYTASFVLAMDSLVLKFEGLLREIVKFQGGSTIKVVREESREKTIEDILRMEEITKLFSEDDLLLFNYVFTRKGINLRNNISHSYFIMPSQYKYDQMLLLLMCILKIGNLEAKEIKE